MLSMRLRLPISLVVPLVALLCACQAELERVSEVTKLRILGIQADPPEIAPGESTALRILTADPGGEGRRVVGGGIVVPGLFTPSSSPDTSTLPPLFYALPFTDVNDSGVVVFPHHLGMPSYYSDQGAQVPIAPPGEPLVMTAILFVCAGDGFDEDAAYAVMAQISMGGAGEEAGPDAFLEICSEAGADEGITALKSFDVVTCDPENSALACDGEYAQNANPEIESIALAGEPLSQFFGGQCFECDPEDGCREPLALRGYLTPGSFQRYERSLASNLDQTEVVYERTYISWFVTGGTLDEDRSGNGSTADDVAPDDPFDANWIPPFEGGEFTLWAVAHDIRGGVSWNIYRFSAGASQ